MFNWVFVPGQAINEYPAFANTPTFPASVVGYPKTLMEKRLLINKCIR
jgi:hypothetical protein